MESGWLSRSFEPPTQTISMGDKQQPLPKPLPPAAAGPTMQGIRSDEDLAQFIGSRPGTAVVEFGTAWCIKCHEMFPKFLQLSKQFPQHRYAVAQVETMQQTVSSIRYTPTFAIFSNGKQVDEVVGREAQRLQDHLWLHSD